MLAEIKHRRSQVLSIHNVSRVDSFIQLGMSIRNKTTEEIRVAIDVSEPPVLIDEEKGTPLRMQSNPGIKLASSQSSAEGFTPIPSNAVLHFSLQFASGEVKSGLFSFNLYLLIRGDQQVKKITAPLSVTLKG